MKTCPKCGKQYDGENRLFCDCGGQLTRAATSGQSGEWNAVVQEVTAGVKRMNARMDSLDARLDQNELARRRTQMFPGGIMAEDSGTRDRAGFDSFGEFLHVVRYNPLDSRLAPLQQRALSTDGASGGFLVPDAFDFSLTAYIAREAIVRARARVFPADGEHPDAALELPALDYTNGRRAGVTVGWMGEGPFPTSDGPAWRSIKLEPSQLGAICTLSDKLLRNARVAQETLFSIFGDAIAAAEDEAFLRGNGIAKPLGIFGHSATLGIPRTDAGHIAYADLVNMIAATKPGGSYVWVISRTALPDLMTMTLPGGWMPAFVPAGDMVSGGRLLGLPYVEWEAAPTLGTSGDVQLCDFRSYLVKEGLGTRIDSSNSAGDNFAQSQTSFRVIRSVDGQPGLSAPWVLEDSTKTSPFVQLTDAVA